MRPAQRIRRPQRDDRADAHWPRDPQIGKLLGELEWPELLQKRPGWSFDEAKGELRCEEGRPLTLSIVRPKEHSAGRTGIIFCRAVGGCQECPARPGCLRSDRPRVSKHVELSIPSDTAQRLRARLAVCRGKGVGDKREPSLLEPVTGTIGGLDIAEPLFLPARARQRFKAIFERATLHVVVEPPVPARPQPTLVAVDVADRLRRRKTWEDNVARYALPEGSRVRLTVEASRDLRQLLGEVKSSRSEGGGAC